MKCRHCSKDVPDGFTDCPWCGESRVPNPLAALHVATPASPQISPSPWAARAVPPADTAPATHPAIVWAAFALSFVVVSLAAFVHTIRQFGDFSWNTSATFMGAWAGPYIFSALIVLAFYFITRKKAHDSTKLFAACCGASLLAVLSLFGSPHLAKPLPHSAAVSNAPASVAKAVHPHTPGPWDPAIISLYNDIKSRNDAYLAEISQLDLDAHPLYVPNSFRDTATIRQILAQLDRRNAVAQKYSSWDSIVAKVPVYVGSVNASDADKRKFLAIFTPAVQQMMDQRNAGGRVEQDWLHSTTELYTFMLSHQGAYTISSDGQQGSFLQPVLRDQFNAKLRHATTLKQQFMHALGNFQATQRTVRAQMGMDP